MIDLTGTGAAYLRVSTQDQDTSHQRTAILDWLAKHGGRIAPTNWLEDINWSRTEDESRPSFQRLLSLVDRRKIQWIAVFALDRFAASTPLQQMRYLAQLEYAGCRLYSVTDEALGNLASSELIPLLTGAMKSSQSVTEVHEKSKRSVAGLVEHVGRPIGSDIPYAFDKASIGRDGREKWRLILDGYERDSQGRLAYERNPDGSYRLTERGGNRIPIPLRTRLWRNGQTDQYRGYGHSPSPDEGDSWVLVPSVRQDRIEAVRLAFQWWTTEPITLQEIADRLNNHPQIKAPPTEIGRFYDRFIQGWFRSTLYGYGYQARATVSLAKHFRPVGGEATPVERKPGAKVKSIINPRTNWVTPADPSRFEGNRIVSPETWEKAWDRLTSKKGQRPAPKKDDYWLSGVLRCGECGACLRGYSRRGRTPRLGYACPGYFHKRRAKGPKPCRMNYIDAAVIDSVVTRWLDESLVKLEGLDAAEAGRLLDWAEAAEEHSLSDLLPDHPYGHAAAIHEKAMTDYVRAFYEIWLATRSQNRSKEPLTAKRMAKLYAEGNRGRLAKVHRELEEARSDYDTMVENYSRAKSDLLRSRLEVQLAMQEVKIRELEAKAVPLDQKLTAAREAVEKARLTMEEVRRQVTAGRSLRDRAVAIKRVVQEIVVYYEDGPTRRGRLLASPKGVVVVPQGALAGARAEGTGFVLAALAGSQGSRPLPQCQNQCQV
ncbi:MAG: recombinase family protein [Gemmataceae bacterium]